MQLHLSPSMRSITISSSNNNGFVDSMKIKVAARHFSYRHLFYFILLCACFLPFVFILTAYATLEGVNKCSSFGTFFLSWFDVFFIVWMFLFLLLLFVFDYPIFCLWLYWYWVEIFWFCLASTFEKEEA